ncbi:hypothetical protein VTK26DRAFT_1097 [Humicola hyalothermophila]
MFSLPRPGCVAAGQRGHVYIFDSTSGDSYIFLGNLASGSQSTVQLVANMFTKEVVVRKVSKAKLPQTVGAKERGLTSSNNRPENCEVRILEHLNALLHNPVCTVAVTPRWTTCIAHENVSTTVGGPWPRTVISRVSYWKLCNGGSLADWTWDPDCVEVSLNWNPKLPSLPGPSEDRASALPISIVARCIRQVSETLHFMYNAGHEAVYHCDLHLGNVFLHFDPNGADGGLPNFYIGDFGWSRTASEDWANGSDGSLYGPPRGRTASGMPSLGSASPGQRRRWDLDRFGDAIKIMTRLAAPETAGPLTPPDQSSPLSKHAKGLKGLIMMLQFLNDQEALLATKNPRSRPTSLAEFIREAKKLEEAALAAENNTDRFRRFIALGRRRAEHIMKRLKPHVFPSDLALPAEARKTRAENYGRANIEGPWSLMESV